MTEQVSTFEMAYARLEEILERMHSGKVALEDALKLYEEADRLIGSCHKKLVDAERKIEVLIKNRETQLQLDAQGQPQVQPFQPTAQAHLGS